MAQTEDRRSGEPARVVVIGSRGVIGRAALDAFSGAPVGRPPVVGISSADVDLTGDGAARELAGLLRPADAVVVLSALTPDKGRDAATLVRNVRMVDAVCAALREVPPSHVVYLSSDAVYPFAGGLVSEESPAAPTDLYGAMHLTREIMLGSLGGDAPLAILRCTLVLSPHDTHNSYGPNRFRRQAEAEGRIVLGGEGEETRDHVLVDDVARFLVETVRRRLCGVINLASGTSHAFNEVASMVAGAMIHRPEIVTTPRNAPVTHRHFDTTRLVSAVPGFRFTPLRDAIRQVHASLGLL